MVRESGYDLINVDADVNYWKKKYFEYVRKNKIGLSHLKEFRYWINDKDYRTIKDIMLEFNWTRAQIHTNLMLLQFSSYCFNSIKIPVFVKKKGIILTDNPILIKKELNRLKQEKNLLNGMYASIKLVEYENKYKRFSYTKSETYEESKEKIYSKRENS